MSKYVVCALYKFVSLPDYKEMRQPLIDVLENNSIKGTLLLAHEGINGTVSGSREAIDNLLNYLNSDERFNPISFKESYDETQPFYRTKVKLKKEIVTLGVDDIDPLKSVGTYVKPKDWNALISDPDVVLIDTRNDYEIEIGTFQNAVDPKTKTFREFPQYVADHMDPGKQKKVAMFCTGGIRCEKSTAFMKQQGFEEVYHLEGGILQYLEDVPKEESMWEGDCFVFDNRVAVNHDLEKSDFDQCHACRIPITEEDKQSEHYEPGVSCPKCIGQHTDDQVARFREREKQIKLAQQRKQAHLGSDARQFTQQRREEKAAEREERRQAITNNQK